MAGGLHTTLHDVAHSKYIKMIIINAPLKETKVFFVSRNVVFPPRVCSIIIYIHSNIFWDEVEYLVIPISALMVFL